VILGPDTGGFVGAETGSFVGGGTGGLVGGLGVGGLLVSCKQPPNPVLAPMLPPQLPADKKL